MTRKFKRISTGYSFMAALCFFALMGIWPASGFAQIRITAQLDRTTAYVRDPVQMEIEVTSDTQPIPRPKLPQIENMAFSEAPGAARTGWSSINGVISYTQTFSFQVLAYQPNNYVIWPIKVEKDGRTYQANKVTLKILEQGRPMEEAPEYFLKLDADKETAYVGEPIVLSFKQYSKYQPTGNLSLDLNTNVFKGFWLEKIQQRELRSYQEQVGSANYYVVLLQQIILFPITSGETTIEPISLNSVLEKPRSKQRTRSRFPSMFDDNFFGIGNVEQFQVKMQSNPLQLNILPLPGQGRPEDFSGAVGQYFLDASVDKTEVTTGEPVTLTVTVKGRGNLKNLSEPVLPDLEAFERFESTKKDNIGVQEGTLQGAVTFEYLIIPKEVDSNVIGPVSLSYFNTALKQYQVAKTQPITLNIKPSDKPKEETVIIGSGKRRREIRVVGEDLRYIHTDPGKLNSSQVNSIPTIWLISLHGIPVAVLGLFVFYLQIQRKKLEDPVWAKQLQAPRQARKGLQQCREHLASGNTEAFYATLQKTLSDYYSRRFNVALGGLTIEERQALFSQRLKNPEQAQNIEAIFNACDEARFAPGAAETQTLQQWLEKTQEVLRQP